ncbi:DNA-binding LacI/PurR family transcriptional regulator [Microbacterium endophyticum]|uniref:DNA-binding LacI/PurR family transcriptional regulator n=1 Tax=Microbacterium endophyticum TaxID=1526412 RepID=A0A7W4YMU2_9MICO|nr:LacI family DNA-binding transcriptional regulator [Microbacterium endophyticum]MBB2975864.1 DNA-binding LacI/PurR family transcriptional regulator [Microbacterium endophyticum]NIK36347.1 DNA-binding LacI/PurR family transcriptional regulator [Microbacterium endophyticum]
MSERNVSMADVAAAAGVSAQTVSRVVNGSPRVDPATRTRVEAAMEDLGYRMHRAARALRTGRTHTIGVVVSTLATVGNSLMLEAVNDAASTRGFAVALVSIGAESVGSALGRLRDQGVDGALVLNEASALAHEAELPQGLRLVVVDSPPDERYTVIETDHFGGARAATTYLRELGHDKIAHIAGPADSYAAAERERGWRAAFDDTAHEPGPLERGTWKAASGYTAALRVLEESAPTALFVANDQMALGALRALGERGLRVPEDVSVIGFDDVEDAANYRPPLTSVRQHFDQLGERAVAALVGDIESSPATAARFLVPALLTARASTAPARSLR